MVRARFARRLECSSHRKGALAAMPRESGARLAQKGIDSHFGPVRPWRDRGDLVTRQGKLQDAIIGYFAGRCAASYYGELAASIEAVCRPAGRQADQVSFEGHETAL